MTRRRIVGIAVAAVTVVVVGLVLGGGLRHPADAGDLPVTHVRDTPAPTLAGRTLDGADFDLASLHGHVVLVNIWASWCDACGEELPLLAQAQQRWSADGLRVIGLDLRDDRTAALKLLRRAGATTITTVDDHNGTTAIRWGVKGVPETFLIGRDGTVRRWAAGAVTNDWLSRYLPPELHR